jgi:2-polyprenyl-3-methyl-5-hydroxy-6-metoxy-1,4-benzoquinol methylase
MNFGSKLHLLPHQQFTKKLLEAEDATMYREDYVPISMPRFKYTLTICRKLKPALDTSVLDVGRSYLSFMLAQSYKNVVTLGMSLDNQGYAHEYEGLQEVCKPCDHIEYDLNDAQLTGISDERRFDLIVFAEVLEHIYTAPELTLHSLSELLTSDGIIVCQTPNATALPKRRRLLLGINPFERIRVNHVNPGHFREYTKFELVQIGRNAGLEAVER